MGRYAVIILLLVVLVGSLAGPATAQNYEFQGDLSPDVEVPTEAPSWLETAIQGELQTMLDSYTGLWDDLKDKFPFSLFTAVIQVFSDLGSADNSWDGVVHFKLIGEDMPMNLDIIPGAIALLRSVWGFLATLMVYRYIYGLFIKQA